MLHAINVIQPIPIIVADLDSERYILCIEEDRARPYHQKKSEHNAGEIIIYSLSMHPFKKVKLSWQRH